METISIGNLNSIFVIGGTTFREAPEHHRLEDKEDRPVEEQDLNNHGMNGSEEDLKMTLFARAENSAA